jgi:hypothetical protein
MGNLLGGDSRHSKNARRFAIPSRAGDAVIMGRLNAPCLGWILGALLSPAAPPAFASCEELLASPASAADGYACLWTLARQGRADEAARRLEGHLADPRARLVLARIETDRGHDAEKLYREAVQGFVRAADAPGEALAHLGLAAFLVRRGRFADAEAAVAEAERIAQRAGDRVLGARVRNQRAWLAQQKGDLTGAWRLFKEVEAEAIPGGPPDLQAVCLSGLAAVAHDTNQLQASMAYLRRQAEVSHRLGDYYDEARARGNLVITAFGLAGAGQMEPAELEPLAQEALSASIAAANPGSEARAHLYLGDLKSGLEAREHYRRGLERGRQVASLTSIVLCLRGLALSLVEAEPRDVPQALRLMEEAERLARPSPTYFAFVRAARARLSALTGPPPRADADALRALDAAEAIRDRQDEDVARARAFSGWTFVYYRLVGHLLSAPAPSSADLELAFSVGERMRARVLLDELDAAQAVAGLAPSGAARNRRSEVLKALAAVQRRLLDPALGRADRDAGLAELEKLEREESALRAEMARADPAFGALRAPRLPSLAELQGLLAEDEALLSFLVASRHDPDHRTTEGGSWLWVVTRRGVRVHRLPDREALRPLVSIFLGLIERRDGSDAASAPRLHRELLASALDGLPPATRRLVVVADGPLHRLPFGALRATPQAPPLAARYVISHAPSATLWARWRSRAPALRADVLVLADPPQHLGPLPHARGEARAIIRHLGVHAIVRTGAAASEPFLKTEDLARFGVLHIAAHAVLDEDRPERSAVLLAPGGTVEDGLLQPREIVGLGLSDPVVFLSACRSAGGVVVDGEGPLSLARAFFQAGARAVVASLWPVRDDESEELVGRFYRYAAEGRGVGEALAGAQRDGIQAGAPAAAWAGVVALGDAEARLGRPADPPSAAGGRWGGALRIALPLTALIVLLFLLRRRRG